jgi:hypothetical protein
MRKILKTPFIGVILEIEILTGAGHSECGRGKGYLLRMYARVTGVKNMSKGLNKCAYCFNEII